jgi:class 3 adenylate cyclase/tetratricopeptide (TPR) repeat protein
VVTVLFADLVGFTGLSETADPEQVKNMVDGCFEHLVADIAAHGGRVDKLLGDAILALFGAPVAHEDDAERAVRAALAMQRSLARWADEQLAPALRMRIGINSGEVLVGALRAGGDVTAMGDVVNTASRLQTAAAPGQVVVGRSTWEATQRVVRYTPLGEVQARGREAPIEAWVAEETIAPPGARIGRRHTPLIGRDEEVGLLSRAVDAAVCRNRPQLLLVVAEAGMGKTRLAEEVAADAEVRHGAVVLDGRCVPYGEANVWWPVAEAVRQGCGIDADDPIEEARDRTLARVRDALGTGNGTGAGTDVDVERVTNGLLHLMGYDGPLQRIDPTRAREEVVRSLLEFVDGWSKVRPVVVVLSDLHWADDVVLELGDVLLERIADRPFVLVATARHNLLERWQPKPGRHNLVVLNLDPLDRNAAGTLLDTLLESEVPDDLRDVLLDRSGGNPFFLEELVSLVAESRTGSTELPHTLRGLVAARLDGLTPDERSVLEDASVLGRRCPVDALVIMGEKVHGLAEISAVVDRLVAKDILEVSEGEYAFRSDLVREVAYGMLTKADRARRHAGIAGWMEQYDHDRPSSVDRIAHHYATAATLVAELGSVEGLGNDLCDRALLWLERALAKAESAELHVVARRLATRGLELPHDGHGARLRFLLARARASTQLREVDTATHDLDEAMVEAEHSGDAHGRACVLLAQGDLEQKRGDLDASVRTLREAIDAFRAIDDAKGEADALRTIGMTQLFAEDIAHAEGAFAEALDLYRTVDDRRGEAWSLQNLAWVSYMSGRTEEAERWLTTSVETFRDIGDQGGLGWALGLLAFVRYHQGRFDEAEELGERMLDEARRRHDVWAAGMMLVLVGSLRLWTGRAESAIAPATEARDLFFDMHDWFGEMQAVGVLGRSLLAVGRVDEGFHEVNTARGRAASMPAATARDIADILVLCAAAQVGEPDRASLAGVPEIDDEGRLGFNDRDIAASLLALQRGDPATALARLERIVEVDATSGYANAAVALARAMVGDAAGADAAARVTSQLDSVTYADRVYALLGVATAHAAIDEPDAAHAAIAEARRITAEGDDVLLARIIDVAAARVAQRLGDDGADDAVRRAHVGLSDLGVVQPGWDTLFRAATTAGHATPQREPA